ncbi:MAG: hypothetical protein HY898_13720 [Deltaproteobacteria bacterium]|nr:hypothetical protein [Deltaproteobacteria bacterium]
MKKLVAALVLLGSILIDRQASGDFTAWNVRFACRDGGVVVGGDCHTGGDFACSMFTQGTEVFGCVDGGAQDAAVAHVTELTCAGTYCSAPMWQCYDAGEYPHPGACQNLLSHGTVKQAEGVLDRPCDELSHYDQLCFEPFRCSDGTDPCGRLEPNEEEGPVLQGCPMPEAGSSPVPQHCIDAGSEASSPDAGSEAPSPAPAASESSGGCSIGTTRVSVSLAFLGVFLMSLWAARRSGSSAPAPDPVPKKDRVQ